jgi:hypothetical protein
VKLAVLVATQVAGILEAAVATQAVILADHRVVAVAGSLAIKSQIKSLLRQVLRVKPIRKKRINLHPLVNSGAGDPPLWYSSSRLSELV